MKKPPGYWTLERCKADAKKYKTRTEWFDKSGGAYQIASKNRWLDDCCMHMEQMKKPNGHWTKERCIKDAKKFKKRTEWELNSGGAYHRARKEGWLNECCEHMEEIQKPNGHWKLDVCKKDALNYKTRTEWQNNSGGYSAAQKNGWLDKCCGHMDELGNLNKRCIYSAEFPDKSIYIGLTFNYKQRIGEHLDKKKKNRSSIIRHIRKTGLQPKFKQLTSYISLKKAKKLEKSYVEEYRNKKYKILNKIATGGSGGNIIIWTKEACIEDALKYNTRKEWGINSGGAYQAAHKNGWLKECCGHMEEIQKPNGHWTLERCIKDAKNYKTRTEWEKKSGGAYYGAQKKGWLDECCEHMEALKKPNGYWKFERCKIDAKKYNTRTEWQKKSGGAYKVARKNKWLNECCGHMEALKKPNGYWKLDVCKKDALNYKTKTEWRKKSSGAYNKAFNNRWLNECCKHMK